MKTTSGETSPRCAHPALGLGEGGEQNAPLGRAVIGGLLFATLATLCFVPVVFSLVHGWLATRQVKTHSEPQGAS